MKISLTHKHLPDDSVAQTFPHSLSHDRLKTITNLKQALQTLKNPAYSFDSQAKRMARSLAILKAKK